MKHYILSFPCDKTPRECCSAMCKEYGKFCPNVPTPKEIPEAEAVRFISVVKKETSPYDLAWMGKIANPTRDV